MKAVLPRPFNLSSKRIFGPALTGLMVSIVILLVLGGMFLTDQFTQRGQKDSRQANSINLSRSFASEIEWTPAQLTTPPQERHNNLQDIGNQFENELRQAKQTIEELTAEHTAVKFKLDGDKRLFEIGLKSQQDVHLSELNERSAWQKLQVAQAQEGLVALKAKQDAILRELEERRQEIARFKKALGDLNPVNPIVKYKREPDHDAIALARQLIATPPSERDEKKLDDLRKLLNESFAIKHEIHEQRLAKLSEEVAKTKETLDKRKSNQAEIVERRMNELLDGPDVMGWEYKPSQSSPAASVYVPLDSQGSVPLNDAPDVASEFRLRRIPQTKMPDSMLGSQLLEALKDLKNGKKGTNRQAIKSMTLKMRYFETSWSNRWQELQSSVAELTKQIDELNKLIKSDWNATDESIRKVAQYQIQSLTERRERVLISVKWMEDFEATQLAEFQKMRELIRLEQIVETEEKLAKEPVPIESK